MKKIGLFLIVIPIFLTGCQLQKVMVSVYEPPKLLVPPGVRSFLVTSRYVPATGPYEDVQWGAYESVDSTKWVQSESVVDTLAKRMVANDQYFVKVRHLPRMLRHNEETMPEQQPWEGMADLAKKEYVQALLVIEGFGISKTPVTVSMNKGSFQARYSVDVTLAIRVYEPEKMRMIDDSVYVFTSAFEGSGKSESEAIGKLPEENKAFLEACSNAAGDYFDLISAGEAKVKRYLYTKNDSTLLVAAKAVDDGKWGRAEQKWKWMAYYNPDTTMQAKASYNMALACERDGRLNQAMGFAKRSERLNPNRHATEYFNILNKKNLEWEEKVKQNKIIKRW